MPKIAFVFPGQGAQAPGMGKELYDNCLAARQIFDTCEGAARLCFDIPKPELDKTANAQPALFAIDLAVAAVMEERLNKLNIKVEGAAGFSLGEVPAAVFAGFFDVRTGYKLVNARAKLMQTCTETNKGGMCAVLGLDAVQVEEICAKIPGTYPVNYNAPSQTVVAFEPDAQAALADAVKSAKGKVIPLAVSGAFHSPLMDTAAKGFAEELAQVKFHKPRLPLYANKTAAVYPDKNPAELLSAQINHPVKWQATIEQMLADGFDIFIEVGPGKTLAGLINKICKAAEKNAAVYSVCDLKSMDNFF